MNGSRIEGEVRRCWQATHRAGVHTTLIDPVLRAADISRHCATNFGVAHSRARTVLRDETQLGCGIANHLSDDTLGFHSCFVFDTLNLFCVKAAIGLGNTFDINDSVQDCP